MEPSVASLTLHPALLIAAGYECLTSKQVRFLNVLRRHYPDRSHHSSDMLTMQLTDCDLGGILNPLTRLQEASHIYSHASARLPNFPHTHKKEIFASFYYENLVQIWNDLIVEACHNLESYSARLRLPNRYFRASHQVIHEMSDTDIYQKISALHNCGLGEKLIDAFDYVFSCFQEAAVATKS